MFARVRTFEMSHSESFLRLEEIGSEGMACPVIPGIKYVREVIDSSNSGLETGQMVVVLMGGM